MAPFFNKNILGEYIRKIREKYDGMTLTIIQRRNIDHNELVKKSWDICRRTVDKDYVLRSIYNAKENSLDSDDSVESFISEKSHFEGIELSENREPLGILVVQRGECEYLKDIWSVKLICAVKQSPYGKTSLGQLLMGAYLYILANHSNRKIVRNRIGILELAGSYMNIAGLASYSKMGFQINPDLIGWDCFLSSVNLPMMVENIDSNRIINIVLGLDTGYKKHYICNIQDRQLQLYVAFCKCVNHHRLHCIKLGEVHCEDELSDSWEESLQKVARFTDFIYFLNNTIGGWAEFNRMIEQFDNQDFGDKTKIFGFNKLFTHWITPVKPAINLTIKKGKSPPTSAPQPLSRNKTRKNLPSATKHRNFLS